MLTDKKLLCVMLSTMLFSISSCALIYNDTGQSNTSAQVFPSQFATEADFLNLANDDPLVREIARKKVFLYYDCLMTIAPITTTQDPVIVFQSQYIAFSEIPKRIYQRRLERLANLVNEYNRIAIQSIVDKEIAELKHVKWEEIQKEVSLIIYRGSKEVNPDNCRSGAAKLLEKRLNHSRPVYFLPPVM